MWRWRFLPEWARWFRRFQICCRTRCRSAWAFLRGIRTAGLVFMPVFRAPAVIRARRTLTMLVAILAFLLLGIGLLAHYYHIGATPPGEAGYQSVVSQLVAAVVGRGPFYFVTMAAVIAVLALSANTSFADFPRVCRVLAQDEFLPA